ncbi:NTPase, partial [Campylobacter upsaliensis]|nr:NTPase [Campylobacter upsaliensis]
TYDEMLDGTFKALKNMSEIANKDIAAMIQEFANSYLKTRGKYEQKKINNLAKEPSFFKQKMNEFFKKKLNKKEFEKERTANKTLSMSK